MKKKRLDRYDHLFTRGTCQGCGSKRAVVAADSVTVEDFISARTNATHRPAWVTPSALSRSRSSSPYFDRKVDIGVPGGMVERLSYLQPGRLLHFEERELAKDPEARLSGRGLPTWYVRAYQRVLYWEAAEEDQDAA